MKRHSIIKGILREGMDQYNLSRISHLPDKEQQKIKDAISSIDTLIEFQEEKLKLLKKHRAGLIQKLIPNNGVNTTADLSFPEFRTNKPSQA